LQFAAGLSASQLEYDRELATRRDAQTEVRRLRVLVQEQAAKLSALAGEQRKRDIIEKNSKEMSSNLAGLEKEMSKLKVERDMTMAEMEELSSSKR
jgi:Rho-type GTPase-activating protein 1/2